MKTPPKGEHKNERNEKNMKKFAIILAVLMLVAALPLTAFAAETYYVAGDSGLCNEQWNVAGSNDVLTDNGDGTYSKTYESVAVGSYGFKVTNGTWDVQWNDGNGNNILITLTAISDVTITLNLNTNTVTYDIVPTGEESGPVVTKYYVVGNEEFVGSSWNPGQEANELVENAGGLYEKTYANVPAGSHAFKITTGTSWNPQWGGTGAGGNYEFSLDAASNVTVLFDATTGEIKLEIVAVGGGEVVPVNPTYIVAGNAGLCGSDWAAADEANEMAQNADGLYEKVYENVPGGNYAFKITDGSWDNAWGNNSDNYYITLTKEGTVTILFNAETKEITVKIVEKEGAEEVVFVYYVAGTAELCGEEWAAKSDANKLTQNEDGLYEIVYKDLKAGDYAFKVTDGTWGGAWGGLGQDGNYEFHLYSDGEVKILFNAETKEITVEGDLIPPTADNSFVYGFAMLMLVSAAAVVLLSKKKAF